ncbi:hypothetical protein CHARACLAT_026590 [Characodon lateralis]|uniref:Uncharacterized protein n=1 Tax=Characodon lateralis TaxID=208331 RepID=A0ABU7DNT8_9TELE|nr:hypothetical protein [Characodon lateralis]
MGRGSEEKTGEPECHAFVIISKMIHFSSVQSWENMRNGCSRLKKQRGNSSPGNKPLWVSPAPASNGLRSGNMDLLIFLYQTDFQLSISSGNGQCGGKVNPPARFCFSRDAPNVIKYDWKWQFKGCLLGFL